MEVVAQEAIDRALGHDLSEPMVARVLFRQAALLDAGIMVSASMPMRDWSGSPRSSPLHRWYGPTEVPMGSMA